MTREERVIEFVKRVRYWLSEQGERVVELEDNGKKNSNEWEQIMRFVEESEWVLVTVYDPTFIVLKDDGVTPALNFLTDWSDGDVEEFTSYWMARWGVGESAAVSVGLTTVTLIEGGSSNSTSGNINLPPGGSDGDYLVKSGNSFAWSTPATILDMGTTN